MFSGVTKDLVRTDPAVAMAAYAVPAKDASYGIAFTAAPGFLSGAQLPVLYDGSTFTSTHPQAQQATILQAASMTHTERCKPSAQLSVDQDALAAHVASTFRQVTGRNPTPADITPDVLWAARQSACTAGKGGEKLCAASSFAYGRALASQVRTTASAPVINCSVRAGVPVPAVMADNAAVVQGVKATVQALQGAQSVQARALNAVLSEQQSLAAAEQTN